MSEYPPSEKELLVIQMVTNHEADLNAYKIGPGRFVILSS